MKLPRNVSGRELGRRLRKLGYELQREAGSHLRYVTFEEGEHHQTIPDHKWLRPGTLNAVLRQVADHHGLTRDELLEILFG